MYSNFILKVICTVYIFLKVLIIPLNFNVISLKLYQVWLTIVLSISEAYIAGGFFIANVVIPIVSPSCLSFALHLIEVFLFYWSLLQRSSS